MIPVIPHYFTGATTRIGSKTLESQLKSYIDIFTISTVSNRDGGGSLRVVDYNSSGGTIIFLKLTRCLLLYAALTHTAYIYERRTPIILKGR